MKIFAHHYNAHIAPKKVRALREVIRGLSAVEAEAQLTLRTDKGSALLNKVLTSAVANATHNYGADPSALLVADVVIDVSFTLARQMPVSRGMSHPIRKRFSHLTIVVDDGKSAAVSRPVKRGAIETVDVATVVKDRALTAAVGHAPVDQPGLAARPLSQQEAAYGKIKTMQPGGEAVTRHRRKSIGN